MRGHDDDDWVGTPPEGRHSRDRAKPQFWGAQWRFSALAAAIVVVLAALLILAVTR